LPPMKAPIEILTRRGDLRSEGKIARIGEEKSQKMIVSRHVSGAYSLRRVPKEIGNPTLEYGERKRRASAFSGHENALPHKRNPW